jgi:signal peptidase I
LLPTDDDRYLIKRVIAVGGDHVSCAGAGAPVVVNEVPLNESYLHPGEYPSIGSFDVVVPEGAVWVMGDNRSHSQDSRAHQNDQPYGGAVPLDLVVGVAQFRTWPFERFGPLRNPSEVFRTVLPQIGAK